MIISHSGWCALERKEDAMVEKRSQALDGGGEEVVERGWGVPRGGAAELEGERHFLVFLFFLSSSFLSFLYLVSVDVRNEVGVLAC